MVTVPYGTGTHSQQASRAVLARRVVWLPPVGSKGRVRLWCDRVTVEVPVWSGVGVMWCVEPSGRAASWPRLSGHLMFVLLEWTGNRFRLDFAGLFAARPEMRPEATQGCGAVGRRGEREARASAGGYFRRDCSAARRNQPTERSEAD